MLMGAVITHGSELQGGVDCCVKYVEYTSFSDQGDSVTKAELTSVSDQGDSVTKAELSGFSDEGGVDKLQ